MQPLLLPPPHHRKHALVFLLLGLFVWAGLLGGLFLYFAARIPQPVTKIYTDLSFSAPSDWKECKNIDGGYDLRYPDIWQAANILKASGVALALNSTGCRGSSIVFSVANYIEEDKNGTVLNVQTFSTQEIMNELRGKGRVPETDVALVAAKFGSEHVLAYALIEGITFTIYDFGNSRSYIGVRKGSVYDLTFDASVDPQTVNIILSNLKFL